MTLKTFPRFTSTISWLQETRQDPRFRGVFVTRSFSFLYVQYGVKILDLLDVCSVTWLVAESKVDRSASCGAKIIGMRSGGDAVLLNLVPLFSIYSG